MKARETELERRQKIAGLSDQSQDALDASPAQLTKHIERLRKDMREAAGNLEFEQAAQIRDEIKRLEALELGL